MKKLTLALAGLLALSAPAFAQGDATEGENVYKKCKACHMVGEGAKNRVGPPLNDIFGRVAGTQTDYKYSKAMIGKSEECLIWTEETLTEYVANPRAYIKGTKMSFAGLKKEDDQEDLIAYLLLFSPDYVPQSGQESDEAAENGETEEGSTEIEGAAIMQPDKIREHQMAYGCGPTQEGETTESQ